MTAGSDSKEMIDGSEGRAIWDCVVKVRDATAVVGNESL